MKTAIATAMIAGLALMGVATSGPASAGSEFPVRTGFSSWHSCYQWVLTEKRNDSHQYDCRDFGADGWTAVWLAK
ncbi:hypothetical protein ACFYV7_30375 [Nocardia suismassiliense]|uniref:Secreted protein n=1 Tax=Nocardia suismassiliense TaxID=2077092 RepID=A0ABW6R0U2_9NOCA